MSAVEPSEDDSIIEKLNRRDSAGLAAAYERYSTLVYSVIVRITRDASVSEDLVQELFLRLWNRSRDFDSAKGSLAVWILAIARNIAIDYIRSSHNRFSLRIQPLPQTELAPISYKASEVDSVIDNTKTIREAFSSLNPNQRRVLEMAYFEGFSQTEIAIRLDEPLGTVKSWIRSGLSRLRAAMQEGRAE